MPAVWHFFATSHDRGPCDGVGVVVERQAVRACLQHVYSDQNHYTTTYCQTQLQGITMNKNSVGRQVLIS